MKIENTNRADLFFMRPEDPRIIVVTDKSHKLYDPRVEIPMDDPALIGLTESIRDIGIQEPVIVRRVGDSFEVIDGRQRVRCAREAFRTGANMLKIPFIVKTVKEFESQKINVALNVHRIEESAIDRGMKAKRMIESGADWEDIEVTFGAKRATVEGWIKLFDAPESVRKAVESGEISATEGTMAARKKDPEKAVKERKKRRVSFEKQDCKVCVDHPVEGENFPEICGTCAHFYANHWRGGNEIQD